VLKVVDLVRNQAIVWDDAGMGATYEVVDIPADKRQPAKEQYIIRGSC
jgi:elongation factor G